MSAAPRKSDCSGCRNDFYNGKNDIGVLECWSFKDAMVEQRMRIGVDAMPPYTKDRGYTTERTLSCWSGAHRVIAIKPEALTSAGYWR